MMMALNIGRLRHRIELLEHRTERDPVTGIITEGWHVVAKRWATVEPLRGRKWFEAQQVQSEVTHQIYMRYMTDVTPDMRIRFRGRMFEVRVVRNIEERNRALDILATERPLEQTG